MTTAQQIPANTTRSRKLSDKIVAAGYVQEKETEWGTEYTHIVAEKLFLPNEVTKEQEAEMVPTIAAASTAFGNHIVRQRIIEQRKRDMR